MVEGREVGRRWWKGGRWRECTARWRECTGCMCIRAYTQQELQHSTHRALEQGCACVCVHACACMRVRACVCVHVCACMCVRACVILMRVHTYACACMCRMQVCTRVMPMRVHTHVHARARTHTHISSLTDAKNGVSLSPCAPGPTDPVGQSYRLLTLCPAPTDPVGQSWPRGTGSVGRGAQGQ